ncbi:MAG TPA: hypothetical protein VF239_06375, partial [Vicinamibacterales bacterium]
IGRNLIRDFDAFPGRIASADDGDGRLAKQRKMAARPKSCRRIGDFPQQLWKGWIVEIDNVHARIPGPLSLTDDDDTAWPAKSQGFRSPGMVTYLL